MPRVDGKCFLSTYAVDRACRSGRMGSVSSPVRCTSARCCCTAVRRRLAAAERTVRRAGHRQLGTLLAGVEDRPFEDASCVAGRSGQADLGLETYPDPGVAPLDAAAPRPPCAHSPLPSSSLSTPCGFP